MTSFYIFLLLTITIEVIGEPEYVPTVVWTSREFQSRKNVDYLLLKNVRSDLFEAYMTELLANKKPLIVVFLEQNLCTDDFQWKNKKTMDSFPFLSELTINSRVDYFRSVASPYETISQLDEYSSHSRRLNQSEKYNEGDLLLLEFDEIKTGRPETLKTHDEQIAKIHRQLVDSELNWVIVYTARHIHDQSFFWELKQMSSWLVERKSPEKSNRALSLYRDDSTGFTLITRGSLQLLLPSCRNSAVENLENYLVASAKPQKDTMNFVIWFPNYTLTFYLSQSKDIWMIERVKLLNGNGDTLVLSERREKPRSDRKCYTRSVEFQSECKPMVKLIVSKYKFLKLELGEESCKRPYGFHVTLCLIVTSILSAVVCWNKMLENWDFSPKSKTVKVSVSTNNLLSLSSKTVL